MTKSVEELATEILIANQTTLAVVAKGHKPYKDSESDLQDLIKINQEFYKAIHKTIVECQKDNSEF